ncbi:hypothetical protein [Herbidospora solisilvae]|uniref:hypothetical protein n=1 Tax=Herbidospora solisilvae TaxID=2696284 RepID=UPI001F2FE662|nr:hypothetical protein [Herbidospora solisilvae]
MGEAHAEARSSGLVKLAGSVPPGFVRVGEVGVPVWPDGASPSLLEEYQVAGAPVERAGETRRVLACCLRMCWADLDAEPWPGVWAAVDDVLACYRTMVGRTDDSVRSWAVGALRRLHDTGWIVLSGFGTLRLGPRCVLWTADGHVQLRELMRRIAAPPPSGEVTPVVEARDEGPEEFGDLLGAFDERRRAELVAAFVAVETAAEPVHEARFAALRDPALRRALMEMLARRGRVLQQRRDAWISGYTDAYRVTSLPEAERAVLALVLVHSVAIPRAEGLLGEDTWLSQYPVATEELRRRTLLPIGELEAALRSLRQAGLIVQQKTSEEGAGGYVPGPQFHRLTRAARARLQEELILAAGPQTPLAVAIRAKRRRHEPAGPDGET